MPDALIIRCARIDEQTMLEAIQRRASLANPGDREALLAHPDAIEVPIAQIRDGRVLVAECAGALCGFAAVLPREDGDAELDALFVEPALQRRGIGRMLIGHCAEFTRASGSQALHVIGNLHAEAFYRACGFIPAGTAQTRFGVGLLMRMPLAGGVENVR
jgi:GNAT superfamily N-acetyltransferase